MCSGSIHYGPIWHVHTGTLQQGRIVNTEVWQCGHCGKVTNHEERAIYYRTSKTVHDIKHLATRHITRQR